MDYLREVIIPMQPLVHSLAHVSDGMVNKNDIKEKRCARKIKQLIPTRSKFKCIQKK